MRPGMIFRVLRNGQPTQQTGNGAPPRHAQPPVPSGSGPAR
jgi:hypothetical protein